MYVGDEGEGGGGEGDGRGCFIKLEVAGNETPKGAHGRELKGIVAVEIRVKAHVVCCVLCVVLNGSDSLTP